MQPILLDTTVAWRLEQLRRAISRYSRDGTPPLTGFRTGLVAEWEGYKDEVYSWGRRRLNATSWVRADIGSGRILECTIRAIELRAEPKFVNNLLQWRVGRFGPTGQSHRRLLEARDDDEKRYTAEDLLFRFYKKKENPPEIFDSMVLAFGARYDLLGYLCFIRNSEQFMPIRPTHFSRAFEILGMPYKMAHRCSWDNYSGYLHRLQWVLKALNRNGLFTDRMLDAHSFCFMLAHKDFPLQPLKRRARYVTFRLGAAEPLSDLDIPSDMLPPFDPDAERDERRRLGALGEAIVLEAERRRLAEGGRADLAERVEDRSYNPALGYDIASFTLEGLPKPIEVKAAARGHDALRFFFSEHQRNKSQELEGYTFALVVDLDSLEPTIFEFAGRDLQKGALRSIQWEARIVIPKAVPIPTKVTGRSG